jgi:alkylation response protein AidB-like acyl-CoA dehydrogenase
MGTVLAVGSDEQISMLDEYQKEGKLGCFSLTEKLAGVQSGLVVQTTCTYDASSKQFILNTPSEGARKNWISQGFTADKTVVLADLIVGGESKGPHAFVMDFRNDGELVPGVVAEDMGKKTVGNDLDNAWIEFNNVPLPRSALLSKYASVSEDGEYTMKVAGVRPFDMIGQRLYTGRIAVAQAALAYRRQLFKQTKEYSDGKRTFSFGGNPVLSDIPQLKALYKENDEKLAELDKFVGECEAALAECLRTDSVPPISLTDAIATCKVQAVDGSIDMTFRLKQEVGSFALMDDAGFKHMDFLQCCKFAEGDSRILMTKMARDRLKQFAKKGEEGDADEIRLCKELAGGMEKNIKSGMNKMQAWDEEWQTVYKLADAVMARIMREGL